MLFAACSFSIPFIHRDQNDPANNLMIRKVANHMKKELFRFFRTDSIASHDALYETENRPCIHVTSRGERFGERILNEDLISFHVFWKLLNDLHPKGIFPRIPQETTEVAPGSPCRGQEHACLVSLPCSKHLIKSDNMFFGYWRIVSTEQRIHENLILLILYPFLFL